MTVVGVDSACRAFSASKDFFFFFGHVYMYRAVQRLHEQLCQSARRRKGLSAAMAVQIDPTVFWERLSKLHKGWLVRRVVPLTYGASNRR